MAYATIQADNRHSCAACRKFGRNGANYRILLNGRPEPERFHWPCAEEIAQAAPEGTAVEVVAVWELARRKREEQEAARNKRVSSFWDRRVPPGTKLSGHAAPAEMPAEAAD